MSEDVLAKCELALGVQIPAATRSYLLTHGGGSDPRKRWAYVQPNDFYRGYNRLGWPPVQAFYRFDQQGPDSVHAECDAIYGAKAAATSVTHLPVCGDSGDMFLVSLAAFAGGSVWWGTREAFWEAGLVEHQTLCRVADDFDGFIRSLRPDEQLPPEARHALPK